MHQQHLFSQSFIQIISVFIDAIVVCSVTAFVVILSGSYIVTIVEAAGAIVIVQQTFIDFMGVYGVIFLTIVLIFFIYTTIIGLYYYLKINFITIFGKSKIVIWAIRIILMLVLFFTNLLHQLHLFRRFMICNNSIN